MRCTSRFTTLAWSTGTILPDTGEARTSPSGRPIAMGIWLGYDFDWRGRRLWAGDWYTWRRANGGWSHPYDPRDRRFAGFAKSRARAWRARRPVPRSESRDLRPLAFRGGAGPMHGTPVRPDGRGGPALPSGGRPPPMSGPAYPSRPPPRTRRPAGRHLAPREPRLRRPPITLQACTASAGTDPTRPGVAPSCRDHASPAARHGPRPGTPAAHAPSH